MPGCAEKPSETATVAKPNTDLLKAPLAPSKQVGQFIQFSDYYFIKLNIETSFSNF